MKKGIRQILCIMTVVISLLTTSALALSADYTFITRSHTEYKRVSTADKETHADVDIHVTDDVNGNMGVYFPGFPQALKWQRRTMIFALQAYMRRDVESIRRLIHQTR